MKENNSIRVIRCRKIVVGYFAAAALVCVLFASSLPAQFAVRPVNLAYLSQRAERHRAGAGHRSPPQSSCRLSQHLLGRGHVECREMVRGFPAVRITFREYLLGLRSRDGKQGYLSASGSFYSRPRPLSMV